MQLDLEKVKEIIIKALNEDIGSGDITSNLTIKDGKNIKAYFIVRENCVIAGLPVLEEIFAIQNSKVKFRPLIIEGSEVKSGTKIFEVEGDAKIILAFERVSLNLLQYMCGIATITRKFVNKVKHTNTKILDTRKTTPNLRVLAKYSVWIGGGKNHRFCLDDGILIKDNHISIVGDIENAVNSAKLNAPKGMKVEVECDNISQVESALKAGADIILLDNMSLDELKKSVNLAKGKAVLEASGGVNLDNVKSIAETGVDYISVGALTHSAPSVDIGLDIFK